MLGVKRAPRVVQRAGLPGREAELPEELLNHVTNNQMLVTCCIDAHFTAFQVSLTRTIKF